MADHNRFDVLHPHEAPASESTLSGSNFLPMDGKNNINPEDQYFIVPVIRNGKYDDSIHRTFSHR